jgi:hypothetical protein
VKAAEVLPERNRVRLLIGRTNQRGEEVLIGEAWVMPARNPIVSERHVDRGGREGRPERGLT